MGLFRFSESLGLKPINKDRFNRLEQFNRLDLEH